LELFDLEEAFSTEKTRLAQAANKYQAAGNEPSDPNMYLELFSLECLLALGFPSTDAKARLHHLAKEMFLIKRSNIN